jgi:hypothetical protein
VAAVKVCPVAPLMGVPFRYHWLPLAALEVSTVLAPAQKVLFPLMVGTARLIWVTTKAVEVAAQLPAAVARTA